MRSRRRLLVRHHRHAGAPRRREPFSLRALFTPRRLKTGVVALAIAAVVGVAGLHHHGDRYASLRVIDDSGNDWHIPEWRTNSGGGQPIPPVDSGSFRFELSNANAEPHDLVLVRTERDPADLPVRGHRVDLTTAGDVIGEIEPLPPGDSAATDAIPLDSGSYVILCNVPGHYEEGMYYELLVR